MSQFSGLAHFEEAIQKSGTLVQDESDVPWKIFFGLTNKSKAFKDATGLTAKKDFVTKEKSVGGIYCRPMLGYKRTKNLNMSVFLGKFRKQLTEKGFDIKKLERVTMAKHYPGIEEPSTETMECIKGAVIFDKKAYAFLFGLIDIKEIDARTFRFDPNENTLGKHLVGRIEIYKLT